MRTEIKQDYKLNLKKFLNIPILLLLLFSCQNYLTPDNLKAKKSNSDEKTQLTTINSANSDNKSSMLEFISPISKPSFNPDIKNEKLITLNVSDETPIKDVLEELARISGLDIDIYPDVSGSVTINANKKPIREVIKRIAEAGNIRYRINNGTIVFYKDYPYIKHYTVNFILDEALWSSLEGGMKDILDKNKQLKDSLPSSLGVIDGTAEESSKSSPDSSIFVNKDVGIISIFANDKDQKAASDYLKKVEEQSSIQVLIEAKVVEVSLSEDYSSGIDWSILQEGESPDVLSFNFVKSFSSFSIQDIAASISILKTFGEAKTIQSPRITTLNNQKARLDFTDKLVYFEVESTSVGAAGDSSNVTESVNSTKKEENVGIVLEITPSISAKDRTIKLKLSPSISVLSSYVADPANPGNNIPVIQERKIETVMKVRSGATLVMGGLMKDTVGETSKGFPILSKIPILNFFFKRDSETSKKVQTVIFIKATILDSQSLNREDNKILNTNGFQ
jgi:type II secretory pathway component GspD/PulD (secretin)